MKKLLYSLLFVSGVLSVSCESNDDADFVTFNSAVVQSADDFTDPRDNNTYHCIQIGNQIWMAENLRYQVPENSFKGCFTWNEDLATLNKSTLPDELFVSTVRQLIYDPQYNGWTEYNVYFPNGALQSTGVQTLEMFLLYLEWGMATQQDIMTMFSAPNMSSFNSILKPTIERAKNIPEIRKQAGYDNFLLAEKKNGGYVSKYGFLYSYDAALEAVPQGWRLPTDEDWMKLETTLGMNPAEVDKMEAWRGKGMATLLNEGGASQFNAQKAGGNVYTQDNSNYYMAKDDGWYYWSSSKYQENDSTMVALVRMSAIHSDKVWRGTSRVTNGHRKVLYSVRCVKDAN